MPLRHRVATGVIVLVFFTAILNAQQVTPQSNLADTSASTSHSAPSAAPAPSPADAAAPTSTPATAAVPALRPIPVLFSATDSQGRPVLSLTKDQLSILDTLREVEPVQLYKGSDLPLHLGIVLVCNQRTFSQQQAAATDLVNKVIRPGVDEAFVVTARCKKPWPGERLDWKRDPAELAKIISGLDPNSGLADPFNFEFETTDVGLDRLNLQTFAGGGVTVFDVAYAMMNSDPRPSRRVLFMFREPWAHSPGFGQRANAAVEAQVIRVVAAARQIHVSTFLIGLEDQQFNRITDVNLGQNYNPTFAGQGAASRSYDEHLQQARVRAYEAGRTNVSRLATETGGAVYWSTKKNFSDAVASIANQVAGEYIVTFVPKDAPTDTHQLKITSKDGSHILAQPSFVSASR